ncbi:redoxin domain-containing protein [Sphingobium sp. AP49]|uniref:TlpA family protein disulfide reductase n=1 Tax=Sphingobium sp. AP49 TaxID=1144307 RepID=UPI00026ED5E5|nr:TlpA family protein disulfide reductase [Sphingobium sp. AP49]WHO40595.1 redoxin domain-containing protein [Sphingobium sp. AP49]
MRSIAAAALMLSMSVGAMNAGAAQAATKPVVGEMAPDFELTLIDGSKVSLADLKGQVVLLNFWATWCVPCRKELPTLDSYYALNQKHGLKVFAITTEGSVPIGQLKKLFAAMHIPSARRIKGPYAPIAAIPTNFIIDRAGKLRYAKAAALDLDDLNALLVPMLNERPPA